MAEERRHARRYGTCAPWTSPSAPTSPWSAPAQPASTPRSWRPTQGASVALVSRSPLAQTASYWAQGGIAAALAAGDSPAQHAEDTLAAGREAARASAVRVLCEESPERVRDLQELGVRFDADRDGNLALGLEGGHSQRRIVHAGGAATGRRITRALSALAATNERIRVLEPLAATAHRDATTAAAAGLTLRPRDGRPARALGARRDPRHRRHGRALGSAPPTRAAPSAPASASPATPGPARRPRVHAVPPDRAAPRRPARRLPRHRGGARRGRDAPERRTASASWTSWRRATRWRSPSRRSCGAAASRRCWLDMRGVDVERFPNIAAALADVGLDPTRDLLPVAPAAHYTMGGIATDLDGRSSLPGLYAVGECACTGLHGANRLASNSLAECLVFGRRAALAACERARRRRRSAGSRRAGACPAAERGHARGALAPRRPAPRRRRARRAARRPLSRSRA